jgi:ankyrin repeat protein
MVNESHDTLKKCAYCREKTNLLIASQQTIDSFTKKPPVNFISKAVAYIIDGKLDFLKQLFKYNADILAHQYENFEWDSNGKLNPLDKTTLLSIAKHHKKTEIVDFILEKLIEDAIDNDLTTSATEIYNHYSMQGKKDEFLVFIEQYIDSKHGDENRFINVMKFLDTQGDLEIQEKFLRDTDRLNTKEIAPSIIPYICSGKHNKIISMLVKTITNIDPLTEERSQIHDAFIDDDKHKLNLLLEKGVNINIEDQHGDTLLSYALKNNKKMMKYILEDCGADINKENLHGESLLKRTVDNGNLADIVTLFELGADFNKRDSLGKTPLMHAVQTKNIAMINLLVELEADINIADNNGTTPLIHAIQGDNTEIINLLLESGADITAPSEQTADKYMFFTLCMRAIEANNLDFFKSLLDNVNNKKLNVDMRSYLTRIFNRTMIYKKDDFFYAMLNHECSKRLNIEKTWTNPEGVARDSLHIAIDSENPKIIKSFFDKLKHLCVTTIRINESLNQLIIEGKIEIMKDLISSCVSNGYYINTIITTVPDNIENRSLLDTACAYKQIEAINIILKYPLVYKKYLYSVYSTNTIKPYKAFVTALNCNSDGEFDIKKAMETHDTKTLHCLLTLALAYQHRDIVLELLQTANIFHYNADFQYLPVLYFIRGIRKDNSELEQAFVKQDRCFIQKIITDGVFYDILGTYVTNPSNTIEYLQRITSANNAPNSVGTPNSAS